jgi:hypothetical protein
LVQVTFYIAIFYHVNRLLFQRKIKADLLERKIQTVIGALQGFDRFQSVADHLLCQPS